MNKMPKETISSMEASQEAKALVLEIRDEIRNERMWAIAEKHLRMAYERGQIDQKFIAEGLDNFASKSLTNQG